jgi:hypothetical protein
MPDFERILDDLAIDQANTPEKKSYLMGYKKGKARARLEIALVFAFVYFGVLAIGRFYT